MNIRLIVLFLGMFICSNTIAWSPSQASPKRVYLLYELFPPFGNSEIEVEVDDDGYIEHLSIKTAGRAIVIPADSLKLFKHPRLADIEIMHYGEKNEESGLGDTFSLCIPYGRIEKVSGGQYWQRPVLEVFVSPRDEKILNIPLPKDNTFYTGANGCDIAGKKLYGY